jgi:hypothetical protein
MADALVDVFGAILRLIIAANGGTSFPSEVVS